MSNCHCDIFSLDIGSKDKCSLRYLLTKTIAHHNICSLRQLLTTIFAHYGAFAHHDFAHKTIAPIILLFNSSSAILPDHVLPVNFEWNVTRFITLLLFLPLIPQPVKVCSPETSCHEFDFSSMVMRRKSLRPTRIPGHQRGESWGGTLMMTIDDVAAFPYEDPFLFQWIIRTYLLFGHWHIWIYTETKINREQGIEPLLISIRYCAPDHILLVQHRNSIHLLIQSLIF